MLNYNPKRCPKCGSGVEVVLGWSIHQRFACCGSDACDWSEELAGSVIVDLDSPTTEAVPRNLDETR